MYCSEVPVDEASGVVMFGQFFLMFTLSVTMEFMLGSRLGTHGTFWLFSITSIIGAWFIYSYVKESKGLTDKQKKELYSKEIGKLDE